MSAGSRKASIRRDTAETKIALEVDLDGTGVSEISTGVAFFDHGTWRPARINFTANAVPGQVGSGLRATETLFHEGGHAAHFANILSDAPCFAQEFAPKIRVNAIAVGSTRTEALQTVLNAEIESQMVRLTPMGRLGEVEDISACALYLAAPASAYLTGDIIGVNGGLLSLNLPMPRAFG